MKTPTMVLKYPGKHQLQDGLYDWLIVDESEVEEALKEGWCRTKEEAKAAYEKATPVSAPSAVIEAFEKLAADVAQNAPPTRAELEQKAAELGIKFDGRTTDKKLTALIAERI